MRKSTSPSPSPSPSPPLTPPLLTFTTLPYQVPTSSSSSSKLPVDFSPPLIAMVIIIAVAFIFITYSRLISRQFLNIHRIYLRWRLRRRRRRYAPSSSSAGNMDSPPYPFDPSSTDAAFYLFSPYGLDESAIRTIPLTIYNNRSKSSSSVLDCAVCLLEFEDNDYVRTLPSCSHSFHVDCIDIWLRSHANCPLCRAGISLYKPPESPFTPLMAARIRPTFLDDDVIIAVETTTSVLEEEEEISASLNSSPFMNMIQSDDRGGRDFRLKRSYSFSFERNIGSERLALDSATTSPWRYRRGGNNGSFWNKRPSPFSSLMKPRVVSFRYSNNNNKGMKSPLFFRRRSSVSFFPLSESSGRFSSSSQRRNFFSSPMFGNRSSAVGGGVGGGSSSSRLRSGDPEALLSPDRYNNRRWR